MSKVVLCQGHSVLGVEGLLLAREQRSSPRSALSFCAVVQFILSTGMFSPVNPPRGLGALTFWGTDKCCQDRRHS